MADVPLGKLADESSERDAVHIAIAPVIAGEDLEPGEDVGFIQGSKTHVTSRTMAVIGIVDPFLTGTVRAGQSFYMLLFPNSVTGMRHHWSHPSFKEEEVEAAPNPPIDWSKLKPDPTPKGPVWRTETVMGLCRQMLDNHDFSALPIMADALEEAGFDQKEVLHKMRATCPDHWEAMKEVCSVYSDEMEKAVAGIDDFAIGTLGTTFSDVMDGAEKYLNEGSWNDDNFMEGSKGDWREFWRNYAVLMHDKPHADDEVPYRCSC